MTRADPAESQTYQSGFGHLSLNQITTEALQRFLSDAKVQPKTVRNFYITFKLMWKTAKAWGYTDKNICEGIVLPRMNEPVKKWFTPSQMKEIITAAAEPYKTMFWVNAECGKVIFRQPSPRKVFAHLPSQPN
jgi:hypothetical protein